MNLHQVEYIAMNRAFPDSAMETELIETHISWVLLSDHFAWKIKKPVAFSFLDFSSLEKRHDICKKEVLLNSRFSKDLYVGLAPVKELDGGIRIGKGKGTIIDWAVKMRRLDSSHQMDNMLLEGEVKPRHIIELGQYLVNVHRQMPRQRKIPSLEIMEARVASLFGFGEKLGDCEQAARLRNQGKVLLPRISDFLRSHYNEMQQRALDGFVLDGHGDLHCGNIFLFDEGPVLFDCLEFNDELRMVDVLDELAFLVMDLEARGFDQYAELLLNTYLEHHRCVKNEEDLKLFYYYKLYRAAVRAKANLLHEGKAHRARASRYLDLIAAYAEQIEIEEMENEK